MLAGLYVHIPFCESKCLYCDFASGVSSQETIEVYLRALEREMAYYAADDRVKAIQFETLFIGGGTPSVLSIQQLARLLEKIHEYFHFQEQSEWTMEANPGSLTVDKIRIAQNLGVNRFSVGVQSFDNTLLKRIGRGHTAEEARQTLYGIQSCDVKNWNLDFIYGLPGQTLHQWSDTLQEAIKWQPSHLSLYNLIVEEGTPFGFMQDAGSLVLPSEDEQYAMMEVADALMQKAGYEHYEISNYAKAGFQCKHNLLYWQNREYLGVGTSAYSFLDHHRFAHTSSVKEYIHHWQEHNSPLVSEDEFTTPDIELTETILMGLRLMQGVSYQEVNRRFGIHFQERFREAIATGIQRQWLEETSQGYLRLTPQAIPIGNQVSLLFLKD